MFSIYSKEIKAFFNSLMGYLVIMVFLTGIGLYMWVFPVTVFDYKIASMGLLFDVGPYVFMFLIPAITMRSFAEEKKAGTLELLLTRPVSEWEIIFGKFLSSLTLAVIALLPTIIYYWSIYLLGNPVGNIDTAAVIGSYIGLLLLGAVFTAIGIFSSSLTDNQIVAFMLSAFMCLIFYEGLGYLAIMEELGVLAYIISKLALDQNYLSLSKGVVDLRNVLYLCSFSFVMLYATKMVINSRKW